MQVKKLIQNITNTIIERSVCKRAAYLEKLKYIQNNHPPKEKLPCGNIAHSVAACTGATKNTLIKDSNINIGIVSAYNDMLSAHQPFKHYPKLIKDNLRKLGSTAQYAGGVPAMCDGVTQGQPGMEISLFSRDVIAMSTAVALSHNTFDGVICLGVCDKIVPGQIMGALSFGHLPTLFIPSGPMTSGINNAQKAKTRQLYAEGGVTRKELLDCEMKSYHSPGTCTFYGTANTNQLVLEVMGLMLPGAAFINPNTPFRQMMTKQASWQIHKLCKEQQPLGIGYMINEKTIVNAIVALLATGGSTNHTIHLIAIAAAAGIIINWSDIALLSDKVPLLVRVYPNGQADINHFQAAGGVAFLIDQLLKGGYLHEDVKTVIGSGLSAYAKEPYIKQGKVYYRKALEKSLDENILCPIDKPFTATGGIRVLEGNLGRCVIKVSAVDKKYFKLKAPAMIFESQQAFTEAFHNEKICHDSIIVVRQQGPSANGMPELHQLTPLLTLLQLRGLKVALITDGRMSGASGKVPAAIQLHPEAVKGGNIAKLVTGDVIEIDISQNSLNANVDFEKRTITMQINQYPTILGADLFSVFREKTNHAELGASISNG